MKNQEEKTINSIDVKGMIEYARKLIRSKSINPPGDYSEISQIALEEQRKIGLEVALFEGYPEKINVFGLMRGSDPKGEVLCLSGHMDVVPVGDEKIWKYPPFGAQIYDNKIWGRGTADMKCALAANLYALDTVKRASIPLRGAVIIGNTVDDETAGVWGMNM